jgi:hypothetical protein
MSLGTLGYFLTQDVIAEKKIEPQASEKCVYVLALLFVSLSLVVKNGY